MSIVLNEDQMRWACEKAENPLKHLLKIYFHQFDKETLQDWCRVNKTTPDKVPTSYKDHAEHIRVTKSQIKKILFCSILLSQGRLNTNIALPAGLYTWILLRIQ